MLIKGTSLVTCTVAIMPYLDKCLDYNMLKLDVNFPILKCWRNKQIFSIPSYWHGIITKLVDIEHADPHFLTGKTYREM